MLNHEKYWLLIEKNPFYQEFFICRIGNSLHNTQVCIKLCLQERKSGEPIWTNSLRQQWALESLLITLGIHIQIARWCWSSRNCYFSKGNREGNSYQWNMAGYQKCGDRRTISLLWEHRKRRNKKLLLTLENKTVALRDYFLTLLLFLLP